MKDDITALAQAAKRAKEKGIYTEAYVRALSELIYEICRDNKSDSMVQKFQKAQILEAIGITPDMHGNRKSEMRDSTPQSLALEAEWCVSNGLRKVGDLYLFERNPSQIRSHVPDPKIYDLTEQALNAKGNNPEGYVAALNGFFYAVLRHTNQPEVFVQTGTNESVGRVPIRQAIACFQKMNIPLRMHLDEKDQTSTDLKSSIKRAEFVATKFLLAVTQKSFSGWNKLVPDLIPNVQLDRMKDKILNLKKEGFSWEYFDALARLVGKAKNASEIEVREVAKELEGLGITAGIHTGKSEEMKPHTAFAHCLLTEWVGGQLVKAVKEGSSFSKAHLLSGPLRLLPDPDTIAKIDVAPPAAPNGSFQHPGTGGIPQRR